MTDLAKEGLSDSVDGRESTNQETFRIEQSTAREFRPQSFHRKLFLLLEDPVNARFCLTICGSQQIASLQINTMYS